MLVENSKKVVIKLGSTTVVDAKGKFKKKVGNVIDKGHTKVWFRKKICHCILGRYCTRSKIFKN